MYLITPFVNVHVVFHFYLSCCDVIGSLYDLLCCCCYPFRAGLGIDPDLLSSSEDEGSDSPKNSPARSTTDDSLPAESESQAAAADNKPGSSSNTTTKQTKERRDNSAPADQGEASPNTESNPSTSQTEENSSDADDKTITNSSNQQDQTAPECTERKTDCQKSEISKSSTETTGGCIVV